jgi:uncharacterized membrane protein YccC
MTELSWRDAVFSLKTFAAAMLAVFIAFKVPLPQPTWAMLTVYVVSQPLAGMVVSKSIFRVVGTVVGAAMSLVLVDLFADTREVFLLALALWIGCCTYVAVYLRDAPAAYGAMLSGYTTAIIGVPAALAPLTAFDLAWARCLEITLGIGCATLVSQIVFPRTVGDVLQATIDNAWSDARQWTIDVLRGQADAASGLTDRRKLVGDIVRLETLRAHAVFDTPAIRAAEMAVRHLQARLMMLMSVLVGVHDRLSILSGERPETVAALRPLLDRVAMRVMPALSTMGGVEADNDAALEQEALDREIMGRLPAFTALQQDRDQLLLYSILLRLDDVRTLCREVQQIRDRILAGAATMAPAVPPFARYRDPMLAAAGALVSTMAVLTAAVFWIVTGWPDGAQAVIFAGVIGSILASLDDPATAATGFLKMTVYAIGVAALYVFVVIPRIDGFTTLMAVLLPFCLPVGMIIALPRLGPLVLPLALNTAALLSLGNDRPFPDLASYLNMSLGLIVGIVAGVLMFRLLRPLGVAWTVRRLIADMMMDLAQITTSSGSVPRFSFESRMYDRISALFTRLNPAEPDDLAAMRGSLAALRIGLNILALTAVRPRLAADPATAVRSVLAALRRKFEAPGWDDGAASPLPIITDAIAKLLAAGPAPGVTEALVALGAIQTSLSQHPDFFALPSARDVASSETVAPLVTA